MLGVDHQHNITVNVEKWVVDFETQKRLNQVAHKVAAPKYAEAPATKERHSEELLGTPDFEKFVKGHDVALVNFYAPWCIWCKRLVRVFLALSLVAARCGSLRVSAWWWWCATPVLTPHHTAWWWLFPFVCPPQHPVWEDTAGRISDRYMKKVQFAKVGEGEHAGCCVVIAVCVGDLRLASRCGCAQHKHRSTAPTPKTWRCARQTTSLRSPRSLCTATTKTTPTSTTTAIARWMH